MVHIRRLLCQTDGTTAPVLDVPDGSDGASHQDQEQATLDGMSGEILLSDLVLALSAAAVDDRNPVGWGAVCVELVNPSPTLRYSSSASPNARLSSGGLR